MKRILSCLLFLMLIFTMSYGFAEETKSKALSEKKKPNLLSMIKDDEVVAIVNGHKITGKMLKDRIKFMGLKYGISFKFLPLEKQKKIIPMVEKQLIDEDILKGYAEKEKIKVDTVKLNQVKERLKKEPKIAKLLKSAGLSENYFLEQIKTQLLINSLFDKWAKNITPSEKELKSFFEKNKEKLFPEKVRAEHILISVPKNATAEEKEKKRKKAEKILAEVKKGANFEKMAQKYSDCPSKKRGGDLGEFTRGKMVKPFEDAAFSLKPGEISDLVKTQFGYHIIKVISHKKGFDSYKKEVKKAYVQDKMGKIVDKKLAEGKKLFKVKILNDLSKL